MMLLPGQGSRRLLGLPDFSCFYNLAGFVEFQGELYLGLIQRGECRIYLIAKNFLQLTPPGIPLFSLELDKDTLARLEHKGPHIRAGRDAADPGKFRPLELKQNALYGFILLDFAKCTPRELHCV